MTLRRGQERSRQRPARRGCRRTRECWRRGSSV